MNAINVFIHKGIKGMLFLVWVQITVPKLKTKQA